VEVEAEGYRTARLGPLNPTAIPDPLAVVMQSISGVTGLISAAGKPVEGAKVSLHRPVQKHRALKLDGMFLCRSHRNEESETATDREGRYRIWPKSPGKFYLRVEKNEFAPAEIFPVDLFAGSRMTERDIVMTEGGSIEGRILLPPGDDPAKTVVGANRGDGFFKRVKADSDGKYRFENLTPGPWQVLKCASDDLIGFSRSLGHCTEQPSIKWSCVVKEGMTTHYDLDLRVEDECVLAGVLEVEGSAPIGWGAWLVRIRANDDNGRNDCRALPESLESNGGFTMKRAEPGSYRLTVGGSLSAKPWGITDRIELERGRNTWKAAFSLGKLSVRGKAKEKGFGQRFTLEWDGPGRMKARTVFRLSSDGSAFLPAVPAGKCRILKDVWSKEKKAWIEKTVAEAVVPKGGTATVELK